MALLTLRGVSLSFGGPKLLDGIDFAIERGERLCLLGRNGEGKTTLLRLLDGEVEPDEGEILRQQGLRVARLPQDVPEGHGGSIAEEVADGLAHDEHSAGADDHRVQTVLSRVGLDPDGRFSDLSSGMKRRVPPAAVARG
ncbi:MAG: ATP-binding cassette domain-containing protein [Isosphaeraceae bacterium]